MTKKQAKNLTEPMYYVLLTLHTPRHGYDMMQMIQEMTDGRVKVGAGTLYSLLARFEKEQVIQQVEDDGRRKTYKITEKGKEVLREEHERLKAMVSDGNRFWGGVADE